MMLEHLQKGKANVPASEGGKYKFRGSASEIAASMMRVHAWLFYYCTDKLDRRLGSYLPLLEILVNSLMADSADVEKRWLTCSISNKKDALPQPTIKNGRRSVSRCSLTRCIIDPEKDIPDG